jgi:hypothetical protein
MVASARAPPSEFPRRGASALKRLAGIGAGAPELEADLLSDDDELVVADLGECAPPDCIWREVLLVLLMSDCAHMPFAEFRADLRRALIAFRHTGGTAFKRPCRP